MTDPVHVLHDLSNPPQGGRSPSVRLLSFEEAAAHPAVGIGLDHEEQRSAQAAASSAASEQRDHDLALIRDAATKDPAFAALARCIGLLPG